MRAFCAAVRLVFTVLSLWTLDSEVDIIPLTMNTSPQEEELGSKSFDSNFLNARNKEEVFSAKNSCLPRENRQWQIAVLPSSHFLLICKYCFDHKNVCFENKIETNWTWRKEIYIKRTDSVCHVNINKKYPTNLLVCKVNIYYYNCLNILIISLQITNIPHQKMRNSMIYWILDKLTG